jgi:hypothetical protein
MLGYLALICCVPLDYAQEEVSLFVQGRSTRIRVLRRHLRMGHVSFNPASDEQSLRLWTRHDMVYPTELKISNYENGYADILARIDLGQFPSFSREVI